VPLVEKLVLARVAAIADDLGPGGWERRRTATRGVLPAGVVDDVVVREAARSISGVPGIDLR